MTPSDFDWAEAHMRATDLYWRLDGLWHSLRPHLLTIDGVDHPAMKCLRQACSELQGVRQALRDEGTKARKADLMANPLGNLKDKTLLRRLAVAAESIGQWQRLVEDAASTAYRCKTPSCDMGVTQHLELVAEYARYLREDMAAFDRLLEELKRRRLASRYHDPSQAREKT